MAMAARTLTIVAGCLCLAANLALAQTSSSDNLSSALFQSDAQPQDPFRIDARTPTIAEFTKFTDKMDGLFRLYQYPRTGKLLMEVRLDQVDKDFLYFAQTENGPLSARHFAGAHRDAKVIQFRRRFDRIEIIERNTDFYIDPASPLHRASGNNVSEALLAALPIVAEDKNGKAVVVDVTTAFLGESFHQVRPADDPYEIKGKAFVLGELSGEKTRYRAVQNYPKNTDVTVAYVYDNPYPLNKGDEAITNPRTVTITLKHSFIALEDTGYKPRLDDWRVGYFTERITDLASQSFTPYRDVIQRWRLDKEDPAAELSPPVKPITLWIENTTPLEFREIIKDAALSWNTAFAAAGIDGALAVEIQPDDANWDAGDIRYNVIRWAASPDAAFGGIGPRLADPRTGEIIASDIVLEYAFITNRAFRGKVFGENAFSPLIEHGSHQYTDDHDCGFAGALQQQLMLGRAAQMAAGVPDSELARLVEEGLRKLVVHEIGHALGLSHNMKGSSVYSLADIQNAETAQNGLSGSIMDYPAINLPHGSAKGPLPFYQTTPGPYDIWAIQMGYTPALPDPAEEEARQRALAERSTEPLLAFGNDADDMRRSYRGIDPRVMINDLSDDPAAWAAGRLDWSQKTLSELKGRMRRNGESWQALHTAFDIITKEQSRAAGIVARQIGGVYVERSNIGQQGAKPPFTPVPEENQRAAMAILSEKVFAPGSFAVSENLARHLQAQRRAYDFRKDGEDPRLGARILGIQKAALAHLLHPNTLERLTDSRSYGNTYSAHDMLSDVTTAIFTADAGTDVTPARQTLQTLYTQSLVRFLKPAKPKRKDQRPVIYDPVARAAAHSQLVRIDELTTEPWFSLGSTSAETRAHRAYLREIIAKHVDSN